MPEINRANRQVCDLLICDLKTMKPFMSFETANVTTVGLSGESVHAMAKGTRRIAFQDPLSGTLGVQAQVYPFKYFSLFSDGVIETEGAYADKKVVTCTTAGALTITAPNNGTIQVGTVFAYPDGEFGNDELAIVGTFADGTFTASTAESIERGKKYIVGYIVNRTGVRKVSFNNQKLPRDYYITMSTLDKDDTGVYTPMKIICYKATIQRNFELSFSSEGDPASVDATFDILEDKDGRYLDFLELEEDAI